MRTLKFMIIMLSFILTCNMVGSVVLYPNVVFYNGDLTVGFSDPNGINTTYLEIGSDYVLLTDYNLSFTASGAIEVNISEYNHMNSLDATNNTLLRFNVTYTGANVNFVFNNTNSTAHTLTYTLHRDGSQISTHTSNFTFSYAGWSTHDFEITGSLHPDPPYNGSSLLDTNTNTVNLTWNTGNYSDRNVVVVSSSGCVSSPDGGTVVQNNTLEYYNFSINGTAEYYSVWSFNESFNAFSLTGLCIPWGAINISVYNQSQPWQEISPFGILVSNVDGSQVYQNVTTSPHIIDVLDIPYGDDVIFVINGTGYKDTKVTKDIDLYTYHQFDVYLSPIETEEDEGGGDAGGSGENYSTTEHYIVQIIDELNNPVPEAKVVINFYNNYTDSWDERESFLTDGYGQGDCWLVPGVLYKVTISADGYNTLTGQNWIPVYIEYSDDRYKTFQLEFEAVEVEEPEIEPEIITFNGYISSDTLYVNYSDSMEETSNTQIYVYEYNYSTETQTLFGSNTKTNNDDFQVSFSNIDNSCQYTVVLFYNHTSFGGQTRTLLFEGSPPAGSDVNIPITTQARGRVLWNAVFFYNPFGWTNTIMMFFVVFTLFEADQENRGIWIFILGLLLLAINSFVGFNTTVSGIANGTIPFVFIAIGIIKYMQDKNRGVST